MKRGVGYCENTDCEDYAKGVFLLNHGDTFYCPRCRQLGKVEKERGFYTGNSDIFKEVRVEYNFDPINGILSSQAGEEIPLPPRPLAVLKLLLERRGDVVSKPELLNEVWSDAVVEEAALSEAVKVLRKALGDNVLRVLSENLPPAGQAPAPDTPR